MSGFLFNADSPVGDIGLVPADHPNACGKIEVRMLGKDGSIYFAVKGQTRVRLEHQGVVKDRVTDLVKLYARSFKESDAYSCVLFPGTVTFFR